MKKGSYLGVLIVVFSIAIVACDDNISLPTIETYSPVFIASNNAFIGCDVISDGGSQIEDCGIYVDVNEKPELAGQKFQLGSDTGSFRGHLSGLTPNKEYYVKAYAINEKGEKLGQQVHFTTPSTVLDIDNNVYNVAKIGNQLWTVENLKTMKFNDGGEIPNVTDKTSWEGLSTPGFCWYNNNPITYGADYGGYYNWYAINTGKLCPAGWHVPNNSDWTTLENYLGGTAAIGVKIKEDGIDHWRNPNTATNESGFTGLPGGYRNYNGDFLGITDVGGWGSATEKDSRDSWDRVVWPNNQYDISFYWKTSGRNVRCIKD